MSFTVEIQPKCCPLCGQRKPCSQLEEIEIVVGQGRLYSKGTDPKLYVDYSDRARADLTVISLNLIPDVKARICGG